VPKIELSYNWGPENSAPTMSEALKQRSQALLRNPLMDLLQAVREHGSIAAAARSLGLSYRHVWGELKKWELRLNQNLIVWEKGMPAELSEFASKLLWAERQAQARLAAPIESLMAEIERTFAVAFDPQAHLLTLYASHDDALIRLRESAAERGLHLDIRFCGSVDAIRALNEGRCEIAGFHTLSQPHENSLSAETYKPLLKPGLGTGTRLLLDELLINHRIKPEEILGYDRLELSHSAVATSIASGQADAGLAIESAALASGLDFIPLVTENYWLACLKSALDSPPVLALREHLSSSDWQISLRAMPGYLANQSGNVHSLRQELPWWNLKPRK
jgi:putative molybdopterin biosynthesis protein